MSAAAGKTMSAASAKASLTASARYWLPKRRPAATSSKGRVVAMAPVGGAAAATVAPPVAAIAVTINGAVTAATTTATRNPVGTTPTQRISILFLFSCSCG